MSSLFDVSFHNGRCTQIYTMCEIHSRTNEKPHASTFSACNTSSHLYLYFFFFFQIFKISSSRSFLRFGCPLWPPHMIYERHCIVCSVDILRQFTSKANEHLQINNYIDKYIVLLLHTVALCSHVLLDSKIWIMC